MSRWAPSLRPSPLFETLIGGLPAEPKFQRVPTPEPAAEPTSEPTPEPAALSSDEFEAVSFPAVRATALRCACAGTDSEGSDWECCQPGSAQGAHSNSEVLPASPSLPDQCKHKPSAPVMQLPPHCEDTPGGGDLRNPGIEVSSGTESPRSGEEEVEDDKEINKRKWPPQEVPITQEVQESNEIQEHMQQRHDEDQERQHSSELTQQRSHAKGGAGRAKARGKAPIGGVVRGVRDTPGDSDKQSSEGRGGRHGGRRRARGRGIVADVASLDFDGGGEGKGHWEPEVASTAPPASETADLASELAEFASEAADLGSVDGVGADQTPSHASSTSRAQHARWADYSEEEEIAPEEALAAVVVVTAEDLTTQQIAEQTLPPSGRKGRIRRRRRGGGTASLSQSQ